MPTWVKTLCHILLALWIAALILITLSVIDPIGSRVHSFSQTISQLSGLQEPFLISFFEHLEFPLNIIMFLPLGLLLPLAARDIGVRSIILTSVALSSAVELFQLSFLVSRTASIFDIVANTIGGALGYVILRFLRKRTQAPNRASRS
jgi:glycopeptide antibiotics resistance protein